MILNRKLTCIIFLNQLHEMDGNRQMVMALNKRLRSSGGQIPQQLFQVIVETTYCKPQ